MPPLHPARPRGWRKCCARRLIISAECLALYAVVKRHAIAAEYTAIIAEELASHPDDQADPGVVKPIGFARSIDVDPRNRPFEGQASFWCSETQNAYYSVPIFTVRQQPVSGPTGEIERLPDADITLGDLVYVNEQSPSHADWQRAVLKVVGLHLAPDGGLWADVIEGDQHHRGNGRYDGETTGFSASELTRFHRTVLPDLEVQR